MNISKLALVRAISVTGIAIGLSGCATDHLHKFYVDTTGGAPVPKQLKKVRPMAFFSDHVLNQVTNLVKDENHMLLGYAEYWTSRPPTIQELQEKGAEVGATVVLCSTRYRETVQQSQPVFNWVPGSTASYTSSGNVIDQGTATAYGNGWSAYGSSQAYGSYSSTASTSTPGYLQYAGERRFDVRLYDVLAVFCRAPDRNPNNPQLRLESQDLQFHTTSSN